METRTGTQEKTFLHGQVHDLGILLRQHIHVWMGFTFLFQWTWLFLQDSFIYTSVDPGSRQGTYDTWNVAIVAFVVVFIVLGLVSRTIDFNFRSVKILVPTAMLMSGGALVVILPDVAGYPADTATAFLASIAFGAATPLLYVEFVRIYLRFNLKEIIMLGGMSTIASSILYLIMAVLPRTASSIIAVSIPLVLLLCLVVSLKQDPVVVSRTRIVHSNIYIPWKLNFTALVQGMGFAAGRWFLVDSQGTTWLSGSESIMYAIGYIVAAFVLMNFVTFMKSNFDKLIYKIGYAFMAVGILMLVLPQMQQVGCFLTAFGYRFVDLLIWTLVIYLVISKKVTVNWLTSWSTAFLYLGFFIGYSVVSATSKDAGLLQISLIAVAFIVLLAALLMTSSKNESNAWGSIRPSDEFLTRPYFKQAKDSIAKRYEFTARQRDVFMMLAEKHTKKTIAEELYLSQETVKVHIHHIYRKLDVHSQQELVGVVEDEERDLPSRGWGHLE